MLERHDAKKMWAVREVNIDHSRLTLQPYEVGTRISRVLQQEQSRSRVAGRIKKDPRRAKDQNIGANLAPHSSLTALAFSLYESLGLLFQIGSLLYLELHEIPWHTNTTRLTSRTLVLLKALWCSIWILLHVIVVQSKPIRCINTCLAKVPICSVIQLNISMCKSKI